MNKSIPNRFREYIKGVVQYLGEVKAEFSKVVWPRRAEFLGSTIVVLLLMAIFAVYLGIVDFGVSKTISYLIFKISLIYSF